MKIMTPGNKNRLRRAVNNTTGVSQNRMAAKFGCSQPYISKTLKNGYRNPIKCRKGVKTPLYKSEQVQRTTKGKCRKLYDHTAQKLIVMDRIPDVWKSSLLFFRFQKSPNKGQNPC